MILSEKSATFRDHALRKVRDRARRLVVLPAEVDLDVVPIGGGKTWIADHPPRRLVTVAAIDRVGKEAFHGDLEQRVEEHVAGEARETGFAAFHGLERGHAVLLAQPVEILAVGLAREL